MNVMLEKDPEKRPASWFVVESVLRRIYDRLYPAKSVPVQTNNSVSKLFADISKNSDSNKIIPIVIIAAFLVFIGNRLCADPGYAGTTGALTATALIFIFSFIGLTPEMFIVGMVIAILTVQGIDQVKASILLGKIADKFNRHAGDD